MEIVRVFNSRLKSVLRPVRDVPLRTHERLTLSRLYRPGRQPAARERHLREAVEWLIRAQDAGPDDGISYGVRFGGGFQDSYPETTGYIIPTFLALAEAWNRRDLQDRAARMGRWEAESSSRMAR